MKVLAIGENAKPFARELWDDAQIDESTLLPGKKRTDYDSLLAYMCLQQVSHREVVKTIQGWMDCLKKGGELTIMVPSLEWAAVQVFSHDRSPVLMHHLFGPQDKPGKFHASAFTMLELRSLCSIVDLAVTHASTNEYMIGEHVSEMHTIRGIKK